MEGERPVRPWEVQELGLVDSVWGMTLRCWQESPTDRPATAEVVGFLREWSVVPLSHTIGVLMCFPQLHATCCEPAVTCFGPMATNGEREWCSNPLTYLPDDHKRKTNSGNLAALQPTKLSGSRVPK